MILKISLNPLDKFFFGGENGFQESGGDRKNRRTSYLLHSRNFPQQTGLLGLVRNQLLLQNGLLRDNSGKVNHRHAAAALIGRHGFRRNYSGNYGVIKKISPVFLENKKGVSWTPGPRDDVMMKQNDQTWKMNLEKKGKLAVFSNYAEKSGLHANFQTTDRILHESKIFKTIKRVGITKSARPSGKPVPKEEQERNYYYQGFKKFAVKPKDDTIPDRFYFYLDLADSTGPDTPCKWTWDDQTSGLTDEENGSFHLKSGVAEAGGERSSFWMEVTKTDLTEFPESSSRYINTKRDSEIKTLLCLSPALVDKAAIRKLALLIVSNTLSFRFLKSSLVANASSTVSNGNNNSDYTAYHQSVYRGTQSKNTERSVVESKLFQLLDRGSAIHFDGKQETKIVKELEKLFNQSDLQNIGYNKYIII